MPVLSVALEVIIILCALLSVTKSGAQIDFHIMLEIRIAMPIICCFDITDQNLPFFFKNEALSCLKELKGISMQSQKLPIAKQNGIEFCDNGLPSLFQMETFLLQNSSTYVDFFFLEFNSLFTPARIHSISGLKSQLLKLPFWLKNDGE